MRSIKTFLLTVSLSFVVSLAVSVVADESQIKSVNELHQADVKSILNHPIGDFPELILPIVEKVNTQTISPEKTKESFVGPPLKDLGRNLLSFEESDIDNNADVIDDSDADLEDEDSDTDEDYNDEEEPIKHENGRHLLNIETNEESNIQKGGSRKLLRFRKVRKAVKKIFHRRRHHGRASSPTPVSSQSRKTSQPNKAPGKKNRHRRRGLKRLCKKNKKKCAEIRKKRCKKNKKYCKKSAPRTKIVINENRKKLDAWLLTSEGKKASQFCISLGILNKPRVFNGCLEDVMITKSKAIAEESAITAEEFLAKDKVSTSKRFCTASGDPHFTNYDGSYFHLQEPGVYTLAKAKKFEVQEKMRKHGSNRPGVPSCMTGVAVRFGKTKVEADVNNYNTIWVNGNPTRLPHNHDLIVGSVKVRFGNQKVEWKGENVNQHGLKITGPKGFGVMVLGGYCGVVEVNAPEEYFGKMKGICGNADGKRDSSDFKDPFGKVMNVNYGARRWEMSGYGGPNAPLSKWQLVWKPTGVDCLFRSDCEADSSATIARRAEKTRRAEQIQFSEIAKRIDKLRKEEEAREREEAIMRERVRQAEEKRRREEARLAEEARKAREAREAEESERQRKREEARLAELARKVEEEKRIEQNRKEKEAKLAEDTRIAKEARKAEEEKLAEETKKLADARKAEEDAKQKLNSDTDSRNTSERKVSVSSSSSSSSSWPSVTVSPSRSSIDVASLLKEIRGRQTFSLSRLSDLSQKVVKLLKDNMDKQIEAYNKAKKDLDFSRSEKKKVLDKYNSENKRYLRIKSEADKLTKIMKEHFDQMNSDSEYLKRLELIKPKFLLTLTKYAKQVDKIKSTISSNIIEGNDKDGMLKMIGDADFNTQQSTGSLSKAFLEHYEKFKNKLSKDKSKYQNDITSLTKAETILRDERKIYNEYHDEYKRAKEIVKKLRETYKMSREDSDSFDQLITIMKAIMQNPNRVKQFLNGSVDGKCATTLLQSHVANNLI